jgi:hypothetical protein
MTTLKRADPPWVPADSTGSRSASYMLVLPNDASGRPCEARDRVCRWFVVTLRSIESIQGRLRTSNIETEGCRQEATFAKTTIFVQQTVIMFTSIHSDVLMKR